MDVKGIDLDNLPLQKGKNTVIGTWIVHYIEALKANRALFIQALDNKRQN